MLDNQAQKNKFEDWLKKQGVSTSQYDLKEQVKYLCFKDLEAAETFENNYFKKSFHPSTIIAHNARFTGIYKLPISPEHKAMLKEAYAVACNKALGITIYSANLRSEDKGCKVALKFNSLDTYKAFLNGFTNIMGTEAFKVLECTERSLQIYILNMGGLVYGSTEHDGSLAINCVSRTAAISLRDMLSLTEEHVDLIEESMVFKKSKLPIIPSREINITTVFSEPVDNRCIKMLQSHPSNDQGRFIKFLSDQIKAVTGSPANVLTTRLLWSCCTLIAVGEPTYRAECYIALSNGLREHLESNFVSFVESTEKQLIAAGK